jgi:hypothetical protein
VDPNSALETSSTPGMHFGINYQRNSSSKSFWETDLSLNRYWESVKTKYSVSSSSSDNTFIVAASAGRGYRIIGKNAYNWLNISAGLAVNFVGSERGYNGASTSRISRAGVVLLEVQSDTYTKHRFYPSIYLGMSKDFRLGKNSFISLTYQRSEGFFPVIRNETETSGTDNFSGMESFNSNFSGSANKFSIGFMRRFGK